MKSEQPDIQPPQPNNKKKLVILGVIAVFLVVSMASAAGFYFLVFDKAEPEKASEQEASQTATTSPTSPGIGGASTVPSVTACPQLETRRRPSKPRHATIGQGESRERIIIRFVDGTGVRLRQGGFASLTGLDLEAVNDLLGQFDVTIERLYSQPEEILEEERRKLETASCTEIPDNNLAYLLHVPPDQEVEGLIDALNELSIVEIAYPDSIVVNP